MPNCLTSFRQVESDDDMFTGSDIVNIPAPERADRLMAALELSELARMLGGEQEPRAPNVHHTIFLL